MLIEARGDEDCAASKLRSVIYQKGTSSSTSTPMQEEAFHSRPQAIAIQLIRSCHSGAFLCHSQLGNY